MITSRSLAAIIKDRTSMKRLICVCVLILLAGCSSAIKDQDGVEKLQVEVQKTLKEEVQEILTDADFEEPLHEKKYRLLLKKEHEGDMLDKEFIIRRLDDTPVTVREMYETIKKFQYELKESLYWYNWSIDRLLEIHDHPSLGIDCPIIPEKATINWHIPIPGME